MKCAGAFLLLGACLLCGIRAAKQLDRNAAQIRLLRQLVTDLMNELRYTLAPVGQLLQTLAGHAAYRELAFLQNAAANADAFPQSWQAAVQSDRQLMPEAAAVLETVGQTLGSTALDGQLSALELCCERLSSLQAAAEQSALKKGALYSSLGLFGGLFCVILLL